MIKMAIFRDLEKFREILGSGLGISEWAKTTVISLPEKKGTQNLALAH